MAVIDAVPGLEVSIWIGGNAVQEYDDIDDKIDGPLASKTVVKYIEAVSDAEFAIDSTVLPSYEMHHRKKEGLSFRAIVDGKNTGGRIWNPARNHSPWTTRKKGCRGVNEQGMNVIRHFKFSAVEIVEITDTEKAKRDALAAARLGELVVDVFRVKIGPKSKDNRKLPNGAVSEITEKAVKGRALSHGTSFGCDKEIGPHKIIACDYLDSKDKPMARFIFRYRSKEALRKLLIIPRSPSPDPFEALSAAEKERLARVAFVRQKGTKQEPGVKSEMKVKRERSKSDSGIDLTEDAPKIKLIKTSMTNPIDLTDD